MARESERQALGRRIRNAWTVRNNDNAFNVVGVDVSILAIDNMVIRLYLLDADNRQSRTLHTHYAETRSESMPDTLDAFLDTFATGNETETEMETENGFVCIECGDTVSIAYPAKTGHVCETCLRGETGMHGHGTTETTARMMNGKMTFPSGRTVDDIWNAGTSETETETMIHRQECLYCGTEYCAAGIRTYCSASCYEYEDGDGTWTPETGDDWHETLCELCQNNETETPDTKNIPFYCRKHGFTDAIPFGDGFRCSECPQSETPSNVIDMQTRKPIATVATETDDDSPYDEDGDVRNRCPVCLEPISPRSRLCGPCQTEWTSMETETETVSTSRYRQPLWDMRTVSAHTANGIQKRTFFSDWNDHSGREIRDILAWLDTLDTVSRVDWRCIESSTDEYADVTHLTVSYIRSMLNETDSEN